MSMLQVSSKVCLALIVAVGNWGAHQSARGQEVPVPKGLKAPGGADRQRVHWGEGRTGEAALL